MKTHHLFRLGCALAGLGLTRLACAEDANAQGRATFVDPSDPAAVSFRRAGEYAIDRLVMTMVSDSATAVARHTEVEALPVCHLKDVPMKNGTVAGLPRITAMKLTSHKLINPANAPDAAEALALAQVQRALESGTPPNILVQTVELPEGAKEWRVYKPLALIRQCGSCHTNADEQAPALRTALQERYPTNQATGYGLGQWRGLIRVTVAEAPPPPTAAPAAPAAAPAAKPGRARKG